MNFFITRPTESDCVPRAAGNLIAAIAIDSEASRNPGHRVTGSATVTSFGKWPRPDDFRRVYVLVDFARHTFRIE